MLYLPSQVATVAIKLALKALLNSETDDAQRSTIDECVRIQGYSPQKKTVKSSKAMADWFDIADEVPAEDEHAFGV